MGRACVRVGSKVSESFEVRVGLRQGCVMSPWLFNIYMDGVVTEVYSRVNGMGVKMRVHGESEWILSQLLFADDTALVAESAEQLQCLVREFGRVCERRKLRVNVEKSKVMSVGVNVETSLPNIMLNGERMEVVNSFKYLGNCFSSDGGGNEDVRERVGVPEKLSKRVDRKVLKWFGHVERMGNERMTKRVYVSEVEGNRGRGRPPFRWRDGV